METIKSALEYLKDFDSYSSYQEEITKVSDYIEQMQADYDRRLREDMAAMLEELDLQIEELFYRKRPFTWDDTGEKGMMDIRPSYDDICFLIREKIKALGGNENA